MLLLDLSDKSIKALTLSPRFLGGKAISAYARGELKPGLVKNSEIRDPAALAGEIQAILKKGVPRPIEEKEAAFILHDERTFTLRLDPPKEKGEKLAAEAAASQAASLLPAPLGSFATALSGSQFVAIDRTLLESYLSLSAALKLSPVLATPESQAIFSLISSSISTEELVLYLDIGAEATDVVVLDKFGVVRTFTAPIETARLVDGVGEIMNLAKEKLGRELGRIFLGGGGALSLDRKKFGEALQREVVGFEKVMEGYPISITANFGSVSPAGFLGLFGLAQLLGEKEALNLIRRDRS